MPVALATAAASVAPAVTAPRGATCNKTSAHVHGCDYDHVTFAANRPNISLVDGGGAQIFASHKSFIGNYFRPPTICVTFWRPNEVGGYVRGDVVMPRGGDSNGRGYVQVMNGDGSAWV